MNDGKLKNLFEMFEPNVKKYKIPYQKSSDFFNSYQNNKFDSKKYNNSNSNTEIFQKNILSNSLNQIYSLNSNINRFQNEISPVNKINVETELSIKRNNKKNSDFNFENIRSLSSNKNNFISNKFLERKSEPLISNNYINDNINNNLNQNFFYLIIIIMKFFNLIMLLIKQGIILMEKIRIKKMIKKIII